MSNTDNHRAAHEAFTSQGAVAAGSSFADDAPYFDAARGLHVKGKDEVVSFLTGWKTAFSDAAVYLGSGYGSMPNVEPSREGRRPLKVHLKIDTGMSRLGFDRDGFLAAAQRLTDADGVEVEGVMTHLAAADERVGADYFAQWQEMPDTEPYPNGFRAEWEAFIRHVVEGTPYKWDLTEGAKGVQLVECALRSWKERRWVDVPDLKI